MADRDFSHCCSVHMDSASSKTASLRIVVHGRVQGVGFRQYTLGKARRLGLLGTVRNMPDGTVVCIAQGEETAMQRFLEELRKGPVFSKVSRVDAAPTPPSDFGDFQIV